MKEQKKTEENKYSKIWINRAVLLAFMDVLMILPTCLIGLIYNNALEMETAYIIALMCALPFIAQKQVIYKVSSETFQKIQDMMGKV